MTIPVALQLYTVREALEKDFVGVTRQIADMGYLGVETYRVPGTSASDMAALFRSLNLKVVAAHSALPLGKDQATVLETMATLGTDTLICPWLDPAKYFQSVDGIKQACALLNEANGVCRANGLTLGYHNHWFEYGKIDGRYAADLLREGLEPDIILEIDTYWAQTAGADPVQIIKTLGTRAPLLHIKDGPCVREEPMVAVGQGKMNVPAIVRAAEGTAKWLIVELDRCATDMLEAVYKSYSYLIGEKLGYGSKS